MATIKQGIVGGFSGSVGPVVGYQWRGRWCMRSHPQSVRNPRTERQQAHRMMFKEEVQLASRMNWALRETFDELSLAEGLTPSNFFIRENQQAFAWSEGQLVVDWGALRLSMGPVAPVAFGVPEVRDETVLTVAFEKNPLHVRADAHDKVHLYVYCPEAKSGYLAAPVYRHTQRVSVVLPRMYAGKEVHLWGLVQDSQGRWSDKAKAVFVRTELGEPIDDVAREYGMKPNAVHQLRHRASHRVDAALRELGRPGGELSDAIRKSGGGIPAI